MTTAQSLTWHRTKPGKFDEVSDFDGSVNEDPYADDFNWHAETPDGTPVVRAGRDDCRPAGTYMAWDVMNLCLNGKLGKGFSSLGEIKEAAEALYQAHGIRV